jgi:branched-chain amino acid transport system substrate-binding protein
MQQKGPRRGWRVAQRWTRQLAVAIALLTAACGARLTDAQQAALRSATTTTTAGPVAGSPSVGGDATATTVTPVPNGATATPGPATPAATTPTTAGRPAAGQAAAVGACTPASSGPSEVGVSPTEVRIGNVSTISGPVPGFGKTGQNGVKAYLNYLRSQGGVCGRQLVLATTDDRLDAGTHRAETERLAKEVMAFVGGTSPVDDGGAPVLNGTNVPDVAFAFSAARGVLPNNFSANPIDPRCECNGTEHILGALKQAHGLSRAAIIYPAQTVARARGLAYRNDLTQAGIATVATYEAPLTGATYSGFVNDMREKQIDLVITTLELNGMADLAKAFRTAGWAPKVRYFGAQAYGRQYLSLAGPAAEGTYAGLTLAALEDRATNPAVNTFITWYERTNPGADIDFFAYLGWSSADLFAVALRAAGPAPTRDAVLQQLRAQTKWDASGLLSPRNPASKERPSCFLIMTVKDGRWQRETPASGFRC